MKRVEDAEKNKMGQRSLKVMKWAEDAQKNKMGQRSPKAMKWAKEAQNSMSTSPVIVLGFWNLAEGKHTASPKEAKFAINSLWGNSNKTTTRMKRNFFWLPLEGHEFAETKITTCLRKAKIEITGPRRKEEKHPHVSYETTHERKLHKFSHMNRRSNPYAQGAKY